MSEQAILRARLSKVQALLARPGHEGERLAAEAAVERIGRRLAELRRETPIPELLHPPSDVWSEGLLDVLENQRNVFHGLYRSNLAWARGAASFVRAALREQGALAGRFWFGAESEG